MLFVRIKKTKSIVLSFGHRIKRVMGIEPTYLAWKASVLPLNYTRVLLYSTIQFFISQEPIITGKTGNAQSRNRTSDTGIFSPLLYRLSYLGICNTLLKTHDILYPVLTDMSSRKWDYSSWVIPSRSTYIIAGSYTISKQSTQSLRRFTTSSTSFIVIIIESISVISSPLFITMSVISCALFPTASLIS